MSLPEDIEKRIVEYLRLEYGEDASDPNALQIPDIAYVGEKEINGVILHCWSYPSLKDDMWATVELLENNSFCLGMCEIPRDAEESIYKYLYLVIEAKKTKKIKIPYVGYEGYKVLSLEKRYEVDLENGKRLAPRHFVWNLTARIHRSGARWGLWATRQSELSTNPPGGAFC